MTYKIFKNIGDRLFGACLLLVTLPILSILLMLVFIEDPSSSPIFKQKRIGYKNNEFNLYKLRSMSSKTHYNGRKLTDKERMLKIGKVIRKTSLDELPQIYNILKGEMSFIGPRPLSIKYLDYYTEQEIKRHRVKPGISGWAQVNGRNTINWEEKFSFDLYYVKNISLQLDLKILFLTLIKIFKSSEVTTRGEGAEVDFHEYRKNN